MSSFVWMKLLESAPERYDRGIRMLTRDGMNEVYERISGLAGERCTGGPNECAQVCPRSRWIWN